VKKLLLVGLMALGLTALSQQRAAAWYKWSISAGFNINFESGNNSWLWGMFKSGQCPGYPTDGYASSGCWGNGGGCGYPAAYGGDFGGYGGYAVADGAHAAPSSGPYVPPAPQPVKPGEPPGSKETSSSRSAASGYYGYQPVGYYYQQPSYSHSHGYQPPPYGYYQPQSYYQAPAYWYGY
jgi:hypothetical protein